MEEKLKKYKVDLHIEGRIIMVVEAKDEASAEELAIATWQSEDVDWDEDVDDIHLEEE